jgi:hypothetical protein
MLILLVAGQLALASPNTTHLPAAGPDVHLGVTAFGPRAGVSFRMDLPADFAFDMSLGGGIGFGSRTWVVVGSFGLSWAPISLRLGDRGGVLSLRVGFGWYGDVRGGWTGSVFGGTTGLYGMAGLEWRPSDPTRRISLFAGIDVSGDPNGGRLRATPTIGVRWRLGGKRRGR